MKTISINRFYGGKADDIREISDTKFSHASHFDIWSNPFRLTPFRTMDPANPTSGSNIKNFVHSGITGKMYAVGVNPSTSKMRLFSTAFDSFTSYTTEATSGTANISDYSVLLEYKDYIIGIHGANNNILWKFGTLSGTPSYTENVATFANSYTKLSNAVIGSDDNVYFGASSATRNDLIKIDSGLSQTIASIVLPTNEKITCVSRYKKYLAIGTVKVNEASISNNNSKIYIWDYVSADASEIIDVTDGNIVNLGEENGELYAVCLTYRSGFGSIASTVISKVVGNSTETIKTLSSVRPVSSRVQVYNGVIYFMGRHVTDYLQTGLYAIGNPSSAYQIGVNLEYQAVSPADTDNPTSLNGFCIVDDYLWISINDDEVLKTYNGSLYTNTSILETLINPKMPLEDRTKRKTLNAVAVSYPPLVSNGQCVLQVSVDGAAFTDVLTETTDGVITSEQTRLASGANLGTGREFQFRVKSTGGAEITEIKYSYEPLETKI